MKYRMPGYRRISQVIGHEPKHLSWLAFMWKGCIRNVMNNQKDTNPEGDLTKSLLTLDIPVYNTVFRLVYFYKRYYTTAETGIPEKLSSFRAS